MVRISKGRQKIEMKKISKASNLQVSFSKRRYGLFKKASELCTLCGAQILMIVFSPGGKIFSFGNPNVRDLIYFFSNNYNHPLFYRQDNNNYQLVRTQPGEHIQLLNDKLTEELEKLEVEKNRRKFLKNLKETREKNGNWWEKDVEDLNMSQTNHLICARQDVKNKLATERFHSQHSENYYIGESSRINITSGGNIDNGTNGFDQRRMLDLSAFTCNPNMVVPEIRPTYGYCNTRGFVSEYNNINYISRNNFN